VSSEQTRCPGRAGQDVCVYAGKDWEVFRCWIQIGRTVRSSARRNKAMDKAKREICYCEYLQYTVCKATGDWERDGTSRTYPLLDHCLLSSARLNHVTLNAQTAWFSDNTCLTTRGNPSGLVCCCCCCYCSDRRSREVICCSRRRHRPQRSRSWCELDKDIWLC